MEATPRKKKIPAEVPLPREEVPAPEGITGYAVPPGSGVAVLTGGKSSRMGQDKALLTLGDHSTFYDRICAKMGFIPERFLSVNASQDLLAPGYTAVPDQHPGTGPMGGILSVLDRFAGQRLLVVACDMPCFTAREGARLLSLHRDEDALVPVVDGRWQPLAAVYAPGMASLFREALRCGERRLRSVIARAHYRLVEIGEEEASNYLNINTPEEFAEFLQQADGKTISAH